MYNPTRRVKQFKRPLSSTRPSYQLPDTSTRFGVPSEDNPTSTSSNYVRHRQAAQPDALRGAMLVALVVVTIVLYTTLWELERSSFASVPKPNLNQGMMAASPSSGNLEATSTRYPPAVFQDGLVSASGEGVKLFNDRTAASSSKPGRTTRNAWPPPVTRVPEEHDTDALAGKADDRTHKNESAELLSFDFAYCNSACRFMLPIRVGEQESKARIHFTQLLMLARRLNRTIVLPNVGKGRMNACSKWQFGEYYDTNEFVHRGDSLDSRLAVDLEGFMRWVDERPAPPRSFLVSMESIPHGYRDVLGAQTQSEDIPFIVEKSEVDPKILSCLESKLPRLRPSLPEIALSISFDRGSLKMESDASTRIAQLLSNSLDMDADSDLDLMTGPGYEYASQYTNSSHLSLADIDVLVLDYDLRYPLFAASVQPTFSLHYAPALYDLADRLSDNLGPFLGVHWRMENVPVENLAWCTASLVSTLRALLQDDVTKNVRHVWLATDHPRPLSTFTDGVRFPVDDGRMSDGIGGGTDASTLQDYGPLRKSSTFKALSSEHDDAIGALAEAFRSGGDLEGWKLTDLSEQLGRYPYLEGRFEVNEALLGDSGVFGILDKLVVVQAMVFVSGSTDCSKTSSFSKQVIEARQESFKAERGKGVIRNVVEYFGKW